MTMPCRITDYKMYNYYEEGEPEVESRSLEELSIYALAGQDFEVYLSKNKEVFLLELQDEDGTVYEDKRLGHYPAETLAAFCRAYLNQYDRLAKD